ncbi:hypothetical protein LTS18_003384 [Coniosporium uncinatum]|uniref:Uncharacterized protein n=1 Tax=Coniosporium uncinatum TaxID=93489 RepID=A0ACC3DZ83_9PEZI|nr:hypothetical protein LTS18_003384 [Coniosporium uncinatum]
MTSNLIEVAEELLASAKAYEGDPAKQMELLALSDEDTKDTSDRRSRRPTLHWSAPKKIPFEDTISASELTMAVNLDESVIIRAMRLLLMHGIAPEPSPDAYHHIPDSLAYVSGTSHHFSEVTLGVQKTARLRLAIFQRDLVSSTPVRLINATDANQGVAVDRDHIYSIDNFSITKRNKTTGEGVLQWYGGEDGQVFHVDGGVVINGTLYAPHSNYLQIPITSSLEMLDTTTMQHIGSHSLGIDRGSLTWIDQHPGTKVWYGTFANYDHVQRGQQLPYGLTMNTRLCQFDGPPAWKCVRS